MKTPNPKSKNWEGYTLTELLAAEADGKERVRAATELCAKHRLLLSEEMLKLEIILARIRNWKQDHRIGEL